MKGKRTLAAVLLTLALSCAAIPSTSACAGYGNNRRPSLPSFKRHRNRIMPLQNQHRHQNGQVEHWSMVREGDILFQTKSSHARWKATIESDTSFLPENT